jgi:nucleoside-diphosphate-sugar epimerase
VSSRILVIGADGFIGRHLVAALSSTDWATPIAAGRAARGTGGGSASWLQLDATDELAVLKALDGIEGVVNCIAGRAENMTAGARALIGAARRLPTPPRVVHLSSMAVYGDVGGRVSEAAALQGADPYARAKIATEQLTAGYGSCVVLRPGIVYGPGGAQWTTRIARWLYSRRIGDLGAGGDGVCNLLYVGDLVVAIMRALRLPEPDAGVFNLAMAQPPTWNEYFIRFARALGAVPVARIGRRRLQLEAKLLAPPLKIAEILASRAGLRRLRLPDAIPPSLLRLCRQEIQLDVTAAELRLEMDWTGLDEGLQRSAMWYRRQVGR